VDTSLKSLSPGTTAGDVDYYTSSTAKARLGIGSTGQVLTVAGGVPSWATASSGGMTLLSTTTLSGASTTISSISQSYKHLQLVIYNVTNSAVGRFGIAPNAATTSCSYIYGTGTASTTATIAQNNGTYMDLSFNYAFLNTGGNTGVVVNIYNYANTTNYKNYNVLSSGRNSNNLFDLSFFANGQYMANTAISSLVFSFSIGTITTGTVLLYGVS
jgi:hypothetical protein